MRMVWVAILPATLFQPSSIPEQLRRRFSPWEPAPPLLPGILIQRFRLRSWIPRAGWWALKLVSEVVTSTSVHP
jgi:hypothetical protein